MTPIEQLAEELGTVRDKVGCVYDDMNETIQHIKFVVEDLEEMQAAKKRVHDLVVAAFLFDSMPGGVVSSC